MASTLALIALLAAWVAGGATRYDVLAPIVPGLAALGVLLVALLVPGRPPLERGERWLWTATFALPLVQLIPLPPAIWSALPGRDYPTALFGALGDAPWLPLSLTPSRTLAGMFGMLPALAVYVTARGLPRETGDRLLVWLVGFALLSGMLGFLQVAGGTGSGLRLYAITNRDAAVGFFSNANHFGVFVAAVAPTAVYLLLRMRLRRGESIVAPLAATLAAVGLLLFAAFASYSRAAMGAGALAVLVGAWLLLGRMNLRGRGKALVVAGVLAGLVVAIFVALRWLGIDERAVDEVGHDGRIGLLPTFGRMIADSFPFGYGLGAFDPVYRGFEDYRFVDFAYLNNAHNDLAQILIEGGLAGLALVVAWLAFVGDAVRRGWARAREHADRARVVAVTFGMAALLGHSLVDYPLRGAAISATFVLFLALLRDRGDTQDVGRAGRGHAA